MSDILMKGTEPIGQVSDITADNVEYSTGVSVKNKIEAVDSKTASDIPYVQGQSVQEKIYSMDTSLANKLNILYKSYWGWNSTTSFSMEITSSADSNSLIVYGARNGRGFLFICPNNNNEVLTIFNNTGCGITNAYDSTTRKHTITLTNPSSTTGSSILVCALGW